MAPAGELSDPLDPVRQQLAQLAKLPTEQMDQPQVRLARAQAQYQLGQLAPALADLDFLIDKKAVTATVLQYRAWTLARLGKAEEAQAELAKYLEQESDPSIQAYVQIVLAAWLGDREDAAKQLDLATTLAGEDCDGLYNAACAAALTAQAYEKTHGDQAKKLTGQALDLLTTAVTHGYPNAQHLRTDADLAGLHADPRFVALLEKLEPPAPYASVWRVEMAVESRLQTGADSPLAGASQLAEDGYRPVAIAVDGSSASSLPWSLVWHRPVVADAAREQLAQRRANAAAALLRMNEPDSVRPLLRYRPDPKLPDQADPRLQTWLIHRMGPLGVDAQVLAKRLGLEKDPSILRALILGLGEFEVQGTAVGDRQSSTAAMDGGAENGSGSPPGLASLTSTLLDLYCNDPDAGIHAASEWLLRRWGQADELRKIDTELAASKIEGDRQWYVNGQGQTLVVIRGPVEFKMGSPAAEQDRSAAETLRRQRIGRTYAIATKEVTVEQYKRFAPDFGHDQMHRCPEPNCPILGVTWYEAGAYCNWLSEQEGLAADQWSYVPNASGQSAEGMKLAANGLERTGYRLPTEAEWEYACRAGAGTQFGYGQSRELLGSYAWYLTNSNERSWPVGQLRPNGLGLYGMHGNVSEWCQDWSKDYFRAGIQADDGATVDAGGSSRVIRGGGWGSGAGCCRAAFRAGFGPSGRDGSLGFRLARTVSLPASSR